MENTQKTQYQSKKSIDDTIYESNDVKKDQNFLNDLDPREIKNITTEYGLDKKVTELIGSINISPFQDKMYNLVSVVGINMYDSALKKHVATSDNNLETIKDLKKLKEAKIYGTIDYKESDSEQEYLTKIQDVSEKDKSITYKLEELKDGARILRSKIIYRNEVIDKINDDIIETNKIASEIKGSSNDSKYAQISSISKDLTKKNMILTKNKELLENFEYKISDMVEDIKDLQSEYNEELKSMRELNVVHNSYSQDNKELKKYLSMKNEKGSTKELIQSMILATENNKGMYEAGEAIRDEKRKASDTATSIAKEAMNKRNNRNRDDELKFNHEKFNQKMDWDSIDSVIYG